VSKDKIIIDVNDGIFVRGLQTAMKNRDPVVKREHQTFDRIKFQGIDRYQMPP
jgi:hypothetical protein